MVEQCPINWRHPSFNWRNPHFCRNPKKIEDVTCHNFSSICLFYLSRVAILTWLIMKNSLASKSNGPGLSVETIHKGVPLLLPKIEELALSRTVIWEETCYPGVDIEKDVAIPWFPWENDLEMVGFPQKNVGLQKGKRVLLSWKSLLKLVV